MNISLTPELEQYVQQKVANGFYHSSSEVIREAIRMLVRFENSSTEFEHYKMDLNQKIQAAIDSAEDNELVSGNKAMEDFKKFRKSQLSSNDQA